jgi:hypothetical protein
MACCGGRQAAKPLPASGVPVAWLHTDRHGGRVPYYDQNLALLAQHRNGGKVEKINTRTNEVLELVVPPTET